MSWISIPNILILNIRPRWKPSALTQMENCLPFPVTVQSTPWNTSRNTCSKKLSLLLIAHNRWCTCSVVSIRTGQKLYLSFKNISWHHWLPPKDSTISPIFWLRSFLDGRPSGEAPSNALCHYSSPRHMELHAWWMDIDVDIRNTVKEKLLRTTSGPNWME